jgi:hypothetical protein
MPLTYNVMPFPKFFAVNASGTPYAGGKLWSYASGLVTPQDTYSDAIGTPNANPVILDSAGRATVYLAPKAYSFELKDSNGVSIWTADPIYGFSLAQDYGVCGGRLTLTTGVPVTTSDVTAATTLYFTPYTGGAVALYDGTAVWGVFPFSELSIAIPNVANQVYDVFASQTAGVVSLSLVAWTNDTTRATAITLQNGVYVKSGGTTFRYLGTIRTTAVAGQTEDSLRRRLVYNWQNRVDRPWLRLEATAAWTYTLATYQQANAAVLNQVDLVNGVAEDAIDLEVVGTFSSNQAEGTIIANVAIGEDSVTTAVAGHVFGGVDNRGGALASLTRATLRKVPAVGYHFYAWLEKSTAVGVTTWRGVSVYGQTGITGSVHQ